MKTPHTVSDIIASALKVDPKRIPLKPELFSRIEKQTRINSQIKVHSIKREQPGEDKLEGKKNKFSKLKVYVYLVKHHP